MSTALTLSNAAIDPYTPRDLAEARQLAEDYAKSKILGAYGTREQVMLVMATGAELGIPPTAALRGLYVVEGRIFMSSDLMVALCLRAPQCERFDLTECSHEAATYTVRRKGGADLTFRFTVEDAKLAGLGQAANSAWKKYPAVMLRHRAAANAARAVFPDVIMGLYSEGEREEIERRDVTPPPAVRPLSPAAPVVDAEVIDPEAQIVAMLNAASSEEELTTATKAALRQWPRERPEAVRDAHRAAKARIAAAPAAAAPVAAPRIDASTGEVTRNPGEEG